MVPEIVSVPLPFLMRPPVPVAITWATRVLPEPSIVSVWAPLIVAPEVTSMVRVSASVWISVAAVSVMAPDNVLLPEALRTAPISTELSLTPSPARDSDSATTSPPLSESVASADTEVLPAVVPSAESLAMANMPFTTCVAPV